MYIKVEPAWIDNGNTFKINLLYQPFFQAYLLLEKIRRYSISDMYAMRL